VWENANYSGPERIFSADELRDRCVKVLHRSLQNRSDDREALAFTAHDCTDESGFGMAGVNRNSDDADFGFLHDARSIDFIPD
jgi:hypothetical protein